MPINAAKLKAVQDRMRAGEVRDAQGMLLELQHEAEQEELESQIAAGNPPPPATAQESVMALLSEIVTHLGSPPKLVTHLANIVAATAPPAVAPQDEAIEHPEAPPAQ
jgi:hypothetical protein